MELQINEKGLLSAHFTDEDYDEYVEWLANSLEYLPYGCGYYSAEADLPQGWLVCVFDYWGECSAHLTIYDDDGREVGGMNIKNDFDVHKFYELLEKNELTLAPEYEHEYEPNLD